jgi:hypothetical protein
MRQFLIAVALCASALSLSVSTADAAMTKQAKDKFVTRCVKSMYYPNAQCVCMAGIADKKLDDLSIAYLSLDPLDVRNSAAMSKKMTGKELAAVDNFMKTVPHSCAGAK